MAVVQEEGKRWVEISVWFARKWERKEKIHKRIKDNYLILYFNKNILSTLLPKLRMDGCIKIELLKSFFFYFEC